MDLGLDGTTAIVTGGSKGIGLAVTQHLIAEGVRGVTGSRTVTPELAASGATAVVADLRTAEGAQRLVDAAQGELGEIDLLVNNVGNGDTEDVTRSVFADLVDLPDEVWQATFDLHFFSALRMIRLSLPSLLRRCGVVVNLSSVAAKVPGQGAYDYNCAKAALHTLTRVVADRYGRQGVRAVAVSPGPVLTRVWADDEGFAGRIAASRGMSLAEYHEEYVEQNRVATGRLTTPDEVARLVTFLAARSNITGADHVIDGGIVKSIL